MSHYLTINQINNTIEAGNFDSLSANLDELQLNPYTDDYNERIYIYHVLSKLYIADFFELLMLTKRKQIKLTMNSFQDNINRILEAEKTGQFQILLKLVSLLPPLFSEINMINFSKKIYNKIQEHIINKLIDMYTCYRKDELAKLLNKTSEEITQIALSHGFDNEEGWIVFRQKNIKNEAKQKAVIRQKLLELTEMSSFLEQFK